MAGLAASCPHFCFSTRFFPQRPYTSSISHQTNSNQNQTTTTKNKNPNFFSKNLSSSGRRKKMKGCELCPGTARMYCESDQARLCFECDAKVHGANFLVARHSRVLLCRICQAPTPWKAAGPRLGLTVSVCDRCVAGGRSAGKNQEEDEGESGERRERVGEEDDGDGGGDDDDDDMDDDDEEDEREEDRESEEEGEEQVVPWTAEPPPVASSSSSEEESVGRIGGRLLKRMRGNVDLPSSSSCSQDQLSCSSSSSRLSYLPNRTGVLSPARTAADDEATSDSFRPLKDCKQLDLIRAGSHGFSDISFGSARPPI